MTVPDVQLHDKNRDTPRRDIQSFAVGILLTFQALAMLAGTLQAPQVWWDAFAGDSFALTVLTAWFAPPLLSLGLGALRRSTNAFLWWSAFLLLSLALTFLVAATFGAYLMGLAIQQDGLIT